MLLVLEALSYKEGLSKLRLFILVCRRLSGDVTEVYKIMRGAVKMDDHSLVPGVEESSTKGHRIKMREERFKDSLKGNCLYTEAGGYMGQAA